MTAYGNKFTTGAGEERGSEEARSGLQPAEQALDEARRRQEVHGPNGAQSTTLQGRPQGLKIKNALTQTDRELGVSLMCGMINL